MLGFVGRATSRELDVDGAEIDEARWFTRDDLRAGIETGDILIPRSVSISSSLIEHWFGGPLPGGW
jgi:NAD+ diphosphatase